MPYPITYSNAFVQCHNESKPRRSNTNNVMVTETFILWSLAGISLWNDFQSTTGKSVFIL